MPDETPAHRVVAPAPVAATTLYQQPDGSYAETPPVVAEPQKPVRPPPRPAVRDTMDGEV